MYVTINVSFEYEFISLFINIFTNILRCHGTVAWPPKLDHCVSDYILLVVIESHNNQYCDC